MTNEQITFEERKLQYIESVARENASPEANWWQYPGPSYYDTDDYAGKWTEAIDASDMAVFKTQKKNWLIFLVLLVVAGLLLYIIGEKSFGFSQAVLLALLLLVVMPLLLDNKSKIMIGHEGIWLHQGDLQYSLEGYTYIKEAQRNLPNIICCSLLR
jgi:hypothetical protein